MSAFFVAAATIDAAVSAFIAKEGPLSLEQATQRGRELWAMNAEAVRWRYELDTRSEEDRQEHAANLAAVAAYAWTQRPLTLAVMVKSLDCLAYQCSEGPSRDMPLFRRLAALTRRYDEMGVQETTDYEQAPWGLDVTDFASELTPEGEQLVIPGCERNRGRTVGQLDLFG